MAYFTADAQAFLRDLEAHNDRHWFQANKARFDASVQTPALRFVADAAGWLEVAGLPYRGEAKKSGGAVSRIYRDSRFSDDKTPYHTHVVLHFGHKEGTKDKLMPVIGIRFDGQEVGLGGGVYGGQTRDLNRVRDAIAADGDAWDRATAGLELWGDSLKTAPKGYDRDHPRIDAIRRKQFMANVPLTPAQFTGDLRGAFQEGTMAMVPFLDFLADALR